MKIIKRLFASFFVKIAYTEISTASFYLIHEIQIPKSLKRK